MINLNYCRLRLSALGLADTEEKEFEQLNAQPSPAQDSGSKRLLLELAQTVCNAAQFAVTIPFWWLLLSSPTLSSLLVPLSLPFLPLNLF